MKTTAVAAVAAFLLLTNAADAQRRRPAPRAAPHACIPGAQVSCACPGGGTGVQRCAADGSGLEDCRCLPSPNAYRPAPAPALQIVERPRNPPTIVRWYGWQTLLLDGGALGLSIAAIGADSLGLAIAGGAVSLLGPPIVHAAHGNWDNAGVSAGLRAANVAFLGFAARNFAPEDFQTAVIACGVIQVGIIVMDSALLGRDRIATPPPGNARLTGASVLVLRDGASLSLSGAF